MALAKQQDPQTADAIDQRRRILVVDDDRLMLKLMGRMLRQQQCVELAHGGQAALDLLAKDRAFDIVLTDILMPVVDGIQLYQEIARNYPELLDRVIFYTGGVESQSKRDYLDSLPNPCLEKPVDRELLWSTIELLSRSKRGQGLL